ncbi:sensor domain-containing diguanylate cyclase [Vreelandella rituensis]|uniref:diguanylate cyclase n=2 Tax=Vreelandella rituensis TaxID=2282306 RepID=A0A368U8I5_9GAMM|nr:sensor domain-containing diguanylate cyclase [Halomonas rituensis]
MELASYAEKMRHDIQRDNRQKLELVDAVAVEAAFQSNNDLADRVVRGLFNGEHVARVVLRDEFGRPLAEHQVSRSAPIGNGWLSQWLFGDILHYIESLEYELDDNSLTQVGEVELLLAPDSLSRQFVERGLEILLISLLEAVALALVVVVGFHFFITRSLLKVYESVINTDPHQPEKWPKPNLPHHRYDEIGRLVESLDTLLHASQRALEQRDQLQQVSTTDGLTGIANRRRFNTFYSQQFSHAQRTGEPISVIFIDIDYFKQFNDDYGHVMGDDTLRAVAHTLTDHVARSKDLVARYNGEKFACVLPGTDKQGATRVAQQLQRAIMNLAIPHAYSPVHHHLTVSMGLASLSPMAPTTPEVLLECAGQRLYQAKRLGRNRIEAGAAENVR